MGIFVRPFGHEGFELQYGINNLGHFALELQHWIEAPGPDAIDALATGHGLTNLLCRNENPLMTAFA